MIGKIKQIFSKTPVESDEPVESTSLTSENPNFLVDPEAIVKLLTELEAESPLCTIQVGGFDTAASSSILGVKVDKDTIILDELIPKEANADLQRSKSLKLSAFHKGIHLSFFLKEVEIGFSQGICYYRAKIPSRVFYPQRRRTLRIEIQTIDVPFHGYAERPGVSISGYLFDISRGGAGISLPVSRARITRGDTLKNCQITFEDYVMDFELGVRFVKQGAPGTSRIQLGGLFEKLSKRSQSRLSHFITSLERVEIRRQKS